MLRLASDSMTLYGIQDGTDSLVMFLSNEQHTFTQQIQKVKWQQTLMLMLIFIEVKLI